MRLIKMFGLTAIAAVAAMAFVGATSALATSTRLCTAHTALTCSSGATSVHLVNEGIARILSNLATILCLTILTEETPLGLENPQSIHTTSRVFQNCGTNSSHTSCEIEVEEMPLYNLLKTGLDEGSLTTTNGQSRVICENIFGFIDIDCKYNTTGILFAAAANHVTANETSIIEVGDKSLCPNESKLDWLLKGLSTTYVLG